MSNRNPRGRRVPAANVGAPVSQPAPTPVDAPAMVATPPDVVAAPVTDDDGVPASISQLERNVAANQPEIEDLIKRLDLGNYVEGLRLSELVGCTWQSLADLRPKALNQPAHITEKVLRSAIGRADPNVSPLVADEISEAIKLAVAASTAENWATARKYLKDIPTRYEAGEAKHVKPQDALDKLNAKLAELKGANDLGAQLSAARIRQAIDAIDSVDGLVKLQKNLNSMRSKGTGRRAVFTMLGVCKPIIEAHSKPEDRGGSYVKWSLKAKTAYEDYMRDALKDATIITAASVEEAVTETLTKAMQVEQGDKLGEAVDVLTAQQRIDKLIEMIESCGKTTKVREAAITPDTVLKLKDALRASGYNHSKAAKADELPVAETTTGRARKDDGRTGQRAGGTVNPPVEVVQPVEQPVQRVVPAAAMSVEEAAAKLAAA